MKTCSICFSILKTSFIQLIRNDFKIIFFCKKKCRINYSYGKKLNIYCYIMYNTFNTVHNKVRVRKIDNKKNRVTEKIKNKNHKLIFLKQYLIKHSKIIILKKLFNITKKISYVQ